MPKADLSLPPLRIGTISKSDLYGGGASRVAQMLAEDLAGMDHHSLHFCNRPGAGFTGNRLPFSNTKAKNNAIRIGHAVARKVGFAESLPLETMSLLRSVRARSLQVVHVHDTTTSVSPITLRMLSHHLPVVWTLHDASPFTGGCIYPLGCERFRVGCGECPQHGRWPLDGLGDFTRMHHRLRKKVHKSGRVRLLAPSRWMSDLAFSSGILAERPTIMPNPVDTRIFAPPADKSALRQRLGLPNEKLVLVALAGDLNDPRKGMAETLRVISALSDLEPHLVLIGNEPQGKLLQELPVRTTVTGFVSNPAVLADWYGAADTFVFCSSMDNQPLTILEAMACGIPTFGFNVGGAGELIRQGESGYMVPHGDIAQLSSVLRQAFVAGFLAEMGSAARRYAVANHDLTSVTNRHVQLYRSLLRPN
jgi:glycosyltransferase involved in cell wall biosynthesis